VWSTAVKFPDTPSLFHKYNKGGEKQRHGERSARKALFSSLRVSWTCTINHFYAFFVLLFNNFPNASLLFLLKPRQTSREKRVITSLIYGNDYDLLLINNKNI